MLKQNYLFIKAKTILIKPFLSFLTITCGGWIIFITNPIIIITSHIEHFTKNNVQLLLLTAILNYLIVITILFVLYVIFCCIVHNTKNKITNSKLHKYFYKFLYYLAYIIIALIISAWLNSTFLLGSYGLLDNREGLEIDPFSILNWVQIGAFITILLLVFYYKNKKILTYAIGYIFITSVLTSIINITPKLLEKSNLLISNRENDLLTYSQQHYNLLFILLDEYQVDYFAEILDKNLKQDLNGFIWFNDAAANFMTTEPAIPAMLSGETYNNHMDFIPYLKSINKNSIPQKMHDQGWRVNNTKIPWKNEHLFLNNTVFIDLLTTNYNYLFNYTIFRILPDMLKKLFYNKKTGIQRIKLNLFNYIDTKSHLEKLQYITNKKIIINNQAGYFNFIYSAITHSPTYYDANCNKFDIIIRDMEDPNYFKNKSQEGKCAMTLVMKLINKLKKANIFDNTMIMITADHGSGYINTSKNKNKNQPYFPYGRAAITLLIKPLYNNKDFAISNAPVQLTDIPKTIATAFKIQHQYPGINMLSDNIQIPRARIFNYYSFRDTKIKNRYFPFTKYKSTGPLQDSSNWSKISK